MSNTVKETNISSVRGEERGIFRHRGRENGEQENPIQIHFIPPNLSNLDTV